jgi:LysM repeat protein
MGIHKNNSFLLGILLLSAAFGATGCVVRTYSVQKERADLDLSSGNRGYLKGKTDAPATVAKTTRENKVVEIEVFPLIKSLKREKTKPVVKEEPKVMEQPQPVPATEQPASLTAATEYTVQANDTLQKIAQKFYGTMHKWKKIYDANKDQLKGPDRIHPGQVLKIPADVRSQAAPEVKAAQPQKPSENLK